MSEVPAASGGRRHMLERVASPQIAAVFASGCHENSENHPRRQGSAGEIANWYAKRGVPVFPTCPTTKRPLTRHGLYDASLDLETIAAWWRAHPTAMISAPTGPASGFWVLDADVKVMPDGTTGMQTLRRLTQANGPLPITMTVVTPSGGLHAYFRWRADRPVRCSAGRLIRTGIDIKGEGGSIVLPGSRRMDGRMYDPVERRVLLDRIAEAPEWLLDMILVPVAVPIAPGVATMLRNESSYVRAALAGEVDAVANAPSGGRNHQLNRSAYLLGQLVGAGVLGEHVAREGLLQAATACGLVAEDGFYSALSTISSGLRAGRASPRNLPEARR